MGRDEVRWGWGEVGCGWCGVGKGGVGRVVVRWRCRATHYPLPTTITTYYSLITTHYSLLYYSLLTTIHYLLLTPNVTFELQHSNDQLAIL